MATCTKHQWAAEMALLDPAVYGTITGYGRKCLTCGTVEVREISGVYDDDTAGHKHQWTRYAYSNGEPERRKCDTCEEEQVRTVNSWRAGLMSSPALDEIASWAGQKLSPSSFRNLDATTGIKDHKHRWMENGVSERGNQLRMCERCAKMQVLIKSPNSLKGKGMPDSGRWADYTGPKPQQEGEPFQMAELTQDHGGIVAYNSATEEVAMADGTIVSLEAMLAANPTADVAEVMDALHDLNKAKFGELGLTAMQVASTFTQFSKAAEEAAEKMRNLTLVALQSGTISETLARQYQEEIPKVQPTLTPDDGIALVIQDIFLAEDPFKVGGEWLTKATSRISEAIRTAEQQREAGDG